MQSSKKKNKHGSSGKQNQPGQHSKGVKQSKTATDSKPSNYETEHPPELADDAQCTVKVSKHSANCGDRLVEENKSDDDKLTAGVGYEQLVDAVSKVILNPDEAAELQLVTVSQLSGVQCTGKPGNLSDTNVLSLPDTNVSSISDANVPSISDANIPSISDANVPSISDANVPSISEDNVSSSFDTNLTISSATSIDCCKADENLHFTPCSDADITAKSRSSSNSSNNTKRKNSNSDKQDLEARADDDKLLSSQPQSSVRYATDSKNNYVQGVGTTSTGKSLLTKAQAIEQEKGRLFCVALLN